MADCPVCAFMATTGVLVGVEPGELLACWNCGWCWKVMPDGTLRRADTLQPKRRRKRWQRQRGSTGRAKPGSGKH